MSHLDGLIDRFLEDHRESDGGYAKITPKDIQELREIVQWLIELKCSEDPDGDLPIDFVIVNRRTHERMHYAPVPYRDGAEGDDDPIPFIEMVRILHMNLSIASDRLDNEFKVEFHRDRRKGI
jgi:hypothetical protein